jgi:phosphoglycolate phosphatase
MIFTTKPQAILFDFDNTLADTWPLIHQALSECFVAMGRVPWTLEQTKADIHRSMKDYFPSLFGGDWQEAQTIYRANYRRHRLVHLNPLPRAEELLQLLTGHDDVYVALVSNKPGHSLREDVEHLQWERYFTKVIGSSDAEEDKPSVMPVVMALDGSGVELEDHIWFVGDSITDMECAHNAKLCPILYGEIPRDSRIYTDFPPTLHIKDHHELIKILQNFS